MKDGEKKAHWLVTLRLKEVHSSEFPWLCAVIIYPGLWSGEASIMEILMSTDKNQTNQNPQKKPPHLSSQRTRKGATKQDTKLLDKNHSVTVKHLRKKTTIMYTLPLPL